MYIGFCWPVHTAGWDINVSWNRISQLLDKISTSSTLNLERQFEDMNYILQIIELYIPDYVYIWNVSLK